MASGFYTAFKKTFADRSNTAGGVDLDTDTIKIMLVTSTYVPNFGTHVYKSDVTNEVASANYTAGGAALANKLVVQDTPGGRSYFDADDVSWVNVTFTCRGAVIYKDTGNAATSPLICYLDFVVDKTVSAGTFSIVWSNTNGIFYII